jgi:pyruvate/2-oxoglutarate dehydrogenase complex dihydrolipoamide dehydrogenase (E3) component
VGAHTDPKLMEEIVASGQADIVVLGRQALADPYLPMKARSGRDEDINKCTRCTCCFEATGLYRTFYCATNPVIGHEKEEKFIPPIKEKKKVLVVGGGVAGMQAAITASARGHSVILCEKTDRLGGVLLCEEQVSFKQKLKNYLAHQARTIEKAAVDVRMNTTVTPEYAENLKPDVIIAALGARPVKPAIKGIERTHVFGAEDIYVHPEKAGKEIVILGGGLVGIELGVHMAMNGHEVSIVEMLPQLSFADEGGVHTIALREQIEKLDIKVYTSTTVTEITSGGVLAEGPGGALDLKADTVVYAVGQAPLLKEALALSACAFEFYQIGDCLTPENIMAATQTAYMTARDI